MKLTYDNWADHKGNQARRKTGRPGNVSTTVAKNITDFDKRQ